MFVEKALPVFRMWKDKRSETHWEVLVRVDVDREFVPQRHAVRETLRSNSMDADRRIVLAICKQFSDPYERARAWKEQKEAARRDSTVDHKNLKDSG
jgi:predicted amidohydrolase YtcJ